MHDPYLPVDQQHIDDSCGHDDKFLEKGEDGLWFCTRCEEGPEDFEEADFSGASDEIGYANDR